MLPPGAIHDEASEEAGIKTHEGSRRKGHVASNDNNFSEDEWNSDTSRITEDDIATRSSEVLRIHVPAPPDVRRPRPELNDGSDKFDALRREDPVERRKTVFYGGRNAAPPVLTLEDLDLEAMTRLTITSRSPSPHSVSERRWSHNSAIESTSLSASGGFPHSKADNDAFRVAPGSAQHFGANADNRGPGSPISPLLDPGELRGGKGKRTYKQKFRKVKRVIDLYTYSPYFRKRYHFGIVRGGIALYIWASLIASVPLWSTASQFTRGNAACKLADAKVVIVFFHPVFWNLLVAAIKTSLATYLNMRKRRPQLRVMYTALEHVSLPGTLAYSMYFWGAHKNLDSRRALGLALNNHLIVPVLMITETWAGKTPFAWAQAWEPIVYVAWQALFVCIYAGVTPGCYLVPALNPERNVWWISYPGFIMLYLGGFAIVYILTQVRDHVAPCGQQVFPPAKYGPPMALAP